VLQRETPLKEPSKSSTDQVKPIMREVAVNTEKSADMDGLSDAMTRAELAIAEAVARDDWQHDMDAASLCKGDVLKAKTNVDTDDIDLVVQVDKEVCGLVDDLDMQHGWMHVTFPSMASSLRTSATTRVMKLSSLKHFYVSRGRVLPPMP